MKRNMELSALEENEGPYIHVEQTLAIIKPDAIDKADEIEEIILRHGFAILRVSMCTEFIGPFLAMGVEVEQ